jgi:Transposase zinc-binding domain
MAPALEVADIFRRHGEAFRQAHAGHLGCVERRIMGAITACRAAALGGHVEQCDECGATRIVRVLSRLYRRLFLRDLQNAFDTGNLRFFGELSDPSDPEVFARRLDALRHTNWVVFAKPHSADPNRCWPISAATLIVSPSPTAG